jgi:hypothetical protein
VQRSFENESRQTLCDLMQGSTVAVELEDALAMVANRRRRRSCFRAAA